MATTASQGAIVASNTVTPSTVVANKLGASISPATPHPATPHPAAAPAAPAAPAPAAAKKPLVAAKPPVTNPNQGLGRSGAFFGGLVNLSFTASAYYVARRTEFGSSVNVNGLRCIYAALALAIAGTFFFLFKYDSTWKPILWTLLVGGLSWGPIIYARRDVLTKAGTNTNAGSSSASSEGSESASS